MRRLVQIYAIRLKTELMLQFQYRGSLAIWMLGLVIEPVIYLLIWSAVAQAQGGEANGYSAGRFAAYFMTTMVVTHFTFTWIMYEYSYRIRSGVLAGMLLHPLHPIHSDVCENVIYKILTLAILVPVQVALFYIFEPEFSWELWRIAAFFPALALAALTRFFLEWTLAQCAFWFIETSAINFSYNLVFLFFSGEIAPLSMFPDWMAAVTRYLPFRWCLAFPVEILLGDLPPGAVGTGYLFQLGWCAVMGGGLLLVWKAGVRQFGAAGA